MGTRVVFESSPTNVQQLRDSVASHSQPAVRRTASYPVISTNVLPSDTRVRIENLLYGAAVTYVGTNADEQRAIRDAVGPVARDLKKGQCTMFQAVAWAPTATRDRDPQATEDRRSPDERIPRLRD